MNTYSRSVLLGNDTEAEITWTGEPGTRARTYGRRREDCEPAIPAYGTVLSVSVDGVPRPDLMAQAQETLDDNIRDWIAEKEVVPV